MKYEIITSKVFECFNGDDDPIKVTITKTETNNRTFVKWEDKHHINEWSDYSMDDCILDLKSMYSSIKKISSSVTTTIYFEE